MSNCRGGFCYRFKGDVVEVWLGQPDHQESEYILCVHRSYLPALIAVLRLAESN